MKRMRQLMVNVVEVVEENIQPVPVKAAGMLLVTMSIA